MTRAKPRKVKAIPDDNVRWITFIEEDLLGGGGRASGWGDMRDAPIEERIGDFVVRMQSHGVGWYQIQIFGDKKKMPPNIIKAIREYLPTRRLKNGKRTVQKIRGKKKATELTKTVINIMRLAL